MLAHPRFAIETGAGVVAIVLVGCGASSHELTGDRGEHLRVVHRDVSPQNIIVSTNGVAKLLDFGLAKRVGEAEVTQAGTLMGTVACMSPEQARRFRAN